MKVSKMDFNDVDDPANRYEVQGLIDSGVFGRIYAAVDKESNNKKVAIKVQKLTCSTKKFIVREYAILRDFSHHINLVDFYGIYRKGDDVWMILEYCEGGSVIDLVNMLVKKNQRLSEEHIAYILKEIIKALIYLHENNIVHRDVKAKNILLTKEGDVKLADIGLSRSLKDAMDKTGTCIGSPCWMAPEVVQANPASTTYGNRVDVWAVGITAIELGDGKAPFQNMHPTRALFQIVRNPPPTLTRPFSWSQSFIDFINECLVKNPEYRPYMVEIIEHPFLEQVPSNSFHLSLELKALIQDIGTVKKKDSQDYNIIDNKLKKHIDTGVEEMYVEDLAALEDVNETIILDQLETRMSNGEFQTFIGEVLLVINPNERKDIFGETYHQKYSLKSRSENAPHIYAVADTAYQNALHHVVPQVVVLTGECASGKTTNYLHLVDHLIFLGQNPNVNSERILKAIKLIHALTHASTPFNKHSTRCILKTELAYGATGKVTGGSFKVECLEKCRISTVDMSQGNFHMLYYVFDGLNAEGRLKHYFLDNSTSYRYLRVTDNNKPYDSTTNIEKFKKILTYMEEFDFSADQIETILRIVSAIIILGQIKFHETDDNSAVLEQNGNINRIADLLRIESKKFRWALTNYCVKKSKSVVRKKNTADEARDARDVFANTLYQRVLDYIVEIINQKLYIGKAIFGEKYTVKLLDYFGFECFEQNGLPQLFINCLNEQIQYHYLQRLFSFEIMDMKTEEVEYRPFPFYNNRVTLDELLQKPLGLITCVDQASKLGFSGKYITDFVEKNEFSRLSVKNHSEFAIAHFTGRVSYSVVDMPFKNRDFLPPEIIETLRLSDNPIIAQLFTLKLDRTGNLIVPRESEEQKGKFDFQTKDKRQQDYSQIRKMRTCSTIFRAICLDLIKELSGNIGIHFVRCVKPNLKGQPNVFQRELVKQQIRAMAITETAKAKQTGYSYRVSFAEFLRRYKFLAFDFDEPVEISKENCRLLLLRLNIEEGWSIGKSKVFLRYYNEEYLSRLYEIQVKKIIKIQSMLRGFLVKCRMSKNKKTESTKSAVYNAARRLSQMTEEEAASIIQQAYRKVKLHSEASQDLEPLTPEVKKFITPYAMKWKNKSIFHVLIQYRAARLQDLFNFSQQVHLYNLNSYHYSLKVNKEVDIEEIDRTASVRRWLGEHKPTVLKVYFRLEDIPLYDTSGMVDGLTNSGISAEKDEPWDSPYRTRGITFPQFDKSPKKHQPEKLTKNSTCLINLNFDRDPKSNLKPLPEYVDEFHDNRSSYEKTKEKKNVVNLETERQAKDFYNRNIGAKSVATKPANKDFDYIKASPVNRPRVDPIAELKNYGRKSSTTSDDPPFNFQGMLRKTNYRKDEFVGEKVMEGVRRFSLKSNKPIVVNTNGIIDETMEFKKVSEELVPGMFIEGFEIEL